MKICRFVKSGGQLAVGLLIDETTVLDCSGEGVSRLADFLEGEAGARATELAKKDLPRLQLAEVKLLAPVERQEIWAAGVTYLRSKKARMEESEFSASAYDKVYDASRPEIFFKSLPEKVVGPGDTVGIRRDARWNVPEPELGLVINARGKIVGHTICNDMSSRDIEGENLLYLPQAKIYDRSCAVGPWIRMAASETEVRTWDIRLEIQRESQSVFSGTISVGQIKRRFDELVEFLFRSQSFPHGVILSTGTGIIPPDDFTLQPGDVIKIDISGIGRLENPVTTV
jgi:2-dehydro-3-deoxy-D-arabinonate dehydratase